jgi:hypothetical protein
MVEEGDEAGGVDGEFEGRDDDAGPGEEFQHLPGARVVAVDQIGKDEGGEDGEGVSG